MRSPRRVPLLAALAVATFFSAAARAQLSRIELHAVPSIRLSGEEILTGKTGGPAVMLAGELRLPASSAARFPAVIIVHGSGGMGAATDRWAWELNAAGLAVFILDSFSGRGITSTVTDQSQLNSLAMMVDAYQALGVLAAHSRIDPQRIAVMGFSKGAVAAVYSSLSRFHETYAPPGLGFAAHVGFYTPCNVAYREDEKTTGKPIRMYHGIADDYVAIGHCRSYVERLKAAGADVALAEYPDAQHAFDNFTLPPLFEVRGGQTTRNCFLREGEAGTIVNTRTGQPYDLASDPCVERNPHVGYNKAAQEAALAAVKDFLATALR